MTIKKIAVIGAGIMGSGIAQDCAQSGLSVNLFDLDEATLSQGIDNIKNQLKLLLAKGKITRKDTDKVLTKINTCRDLRKL